MSTAGVKNRDTHGEWQPSELHQPGGILRWPWRLKPVLA